MIYIMTSKTHCHIVPYAIENKTKQFMVEEATGSEHLIRPQFRIQKNNHSFNHMGCTKPCYDPL